MACEAATATAYLLPREKKRAMAFCQLASTFQLATPNDRAGLAVELDAGRSATSSGLTRALAADLGPRRRTVNSVAPGTFATEVNTALTEDPPPPRSSPARSSPSMAA